MGTISRIEIKTKTKEMNRENSRPVISILFILTGIYGILLFLRALDGVSYLEWVVYLVATVLCWTIWYVYFHSRKLFYCFLLVAVVISSFISFLLWDTLQAQATYIVSSLAGKAEMESMQVTELALLLTIILSFLLFVLEFMGGKHEVPYLLTSALPLLSPLLGVRVGAEAILLIVLFQASFLVIQTTGTRRGKQSLSMGNRRRLSGKSSIALSLILAITFLVALPLVSLYSQDFYDSVYGAEGFVYRTLNNLSGNANEPITGSRISRGNNYRTDAAHLELEVTAQPTETLYLRGFGGGEYTGGDWIRSSDKALFVNVAEKLDWREWSYMINGMYYSMYFTLNSTLNGDESPPKVRTLTIRYVDSKYENAYVPYYNQSLRNRRYGTYNVQNGRHAYQYYEQKDMNIDWDNVPPDSERQRDWYQELQKAYTEEAQLAYTKVPVELLPRLTALVEENPLEELDEITAFILFTLHSNAFYTLTPGWAPFNEDVVEYFLFTGGSGYCEHFAATATLMYRLYGIPARYASGYMVSPSDFELQDDETYQAIVTDESAHAWAEIFLEDYGWTPVEVTPSADGASVASYPGFSGIELEQLLKEHNWDMDVPSLAKRDAKNTQTALQTYESGFSLNFQSNLKKHRDIFLILGSCLAYSALLFPLFLDYRRLRRLREMETMHCRMLFSKLIGLLHFGGLLREYDGTEIGFAQNYAASIPTVTKEEAIRLLEIVNKAAYGSTALEDNEEAFVKKIYCHTASYIYTGLTRQKKLVFKYFKVFG